MTMNHDKNQAYITGNFNELVCWQLSLKRHAENVDVLPANITVHPKMADPIISDLADITPPPLQISLGHKK